MQSRLGVFMGACCFTGHRPKYFSFGTDETHPDCRGIKAFLREKSEYLINNKSVTHFISGGAVGVDTWAMEEVIRLKTRYPHIMLECALPYADMPERFALPDRERFAAIKPHLDRITCLNDQYHPKCMMERNMYMVDRSEFVIAVWTGHKSGTANTINYAKEGGQTVLYMEF